jgi:PKD repeat protein
VRWYELVPSQLSAAQHGNIDEGPDFAFNAAISPTIDGSSAVINYNVSGNGSLPRIAARSRRPEAPGGQMSAPVTITSSGAPLADGSCSPAPCRWGDYAGATPDPLNSSVVWGTNEYSASGPWTSRNFALDVGGAGPIASFNASPSSIDSGQAIGFDASATTGSNGVAVNRYQWDLDGDGSFESDTGADPHASHTYAVPGAVTVRLRATDTAGDQSIAERTVAIRNRPPAASFTLSAARIPTGQAVFLDGSASVDPDGRVVHYVWDLDGNGAFETDTGSNAIVATAAFNRAATVTLRLRVTDDHGTSSETARSLTVFKPSPPPPTKQCRAARASVKKLVASVQRLRRQAKHAHGARKRKLARKLRVARHKLANAGVRVRTLC